MATYYSKLIACGQGVHNLTVKDGIITASSVGAAPGFNHWYPDSDAHLLIGKPFKSVYGQGFRKVRMTLRDEAEAAMCEYQDEQNRIDCELYDRAHQQN